MLSELYYQNGVSEIAKEQNNARTEWCETVYEIHWTEANTPNGSVQGEEIIIYEWEVCYNDSDGAPTNTDNELDGGPSSGGGGLTPIGGGNPGVNDNDPIKKCPEGFKNENGSCISAEDFWEKQIDDSKLKPCMQAIMTDLKNLTKGAGQIVQKFSGSTPGYNWKTQHGTLPGSTNANTSQQYNSSTGTVTTTFDTNKFGQVSDLSVARTMLHESVHAYIVASFGSNYSSAQKKFSDFMKDFSSNKYPSRNDTDHAEFVRNYVSDIADALQEYGSNQGYSINRQFYEDLAWGGLTHWAKRDAQGNIVKDSSGNIIYEETSWFKSIYPNTSGRNRVLNTINTELGVTNTKQKGKNAGC